MFRRVFAVFVCAFLCVAFPSSRLKAGPAQVTLRVDSNLVNVFLTVQTPRGEYVTGLPADAFRVYEDDVEQKVSIFEKEDHVESAIGVLMDTSGSNVDILPIMKTGVLDFAQKARRTDEFLCHDLRDQRPGHSGYSSVRTESRCRDQNASSPGNCVLFDALIAE
jgi:Ca-activated chloride channel family protein